MAAGHTTLNFVFDPNQNVNTNDSEAEKTILPILIERHGDEKVKIKWISDLNALKGL